ncbi:MAG: DUF4190 domain-containing protein [Planctomycetota bacterium]|nr:DUF4190 domain-containing protein [Planctomycetota bacterium]
MSNVSVSNWGEPAPKPISATSTPSTSSPSAMRTDSSRQFNEFDYRPVPVLAPTAAALGVGAATTFMSIFGVVIGFLAVVLGLISFFKIRASRGELSGKGVALTGVVLGLTLSTIGSVLHAYEYVHELPEGHIRVHFPTDISRKQFVAKQGMMALHPDVEPFVGQKIFIKGWMWQTQQLDQLKTFVLLKDNGECCFGGTPKPWDMMMVVMADNKTTRSYSGMVSVAGTLRIADQLTPEGPVYFLDATECGPARTSF